MSVPVHQVKQFAVTVAAGVSQAAPTRTLVTFEDGLTIEWIELEVPRGPRGQVGFHVDSSRTPMLPFQVGNPARWFVMDGITVRYDMTGLPDTGDWSVLAYNTGQQPHTFYVRFGVTLPPSAPDVVPPVIVPATVLSGVLAAS